VILWPITAKDSAITAEQEHGLFVYDEAIRVPLIIKQESNTGAGRRVADLVQHVDLVPTILDLVKAPGPAASAADR
jgi:arylsulfatase A-like enzyme